MPFSFNDTKLETIKFILELGKNLKVLDIGVGSGTYSNLLRSKVKKIDGVEIFKPYIKKFNLKQKYDNIFEIDIKDFAANENYDVAIFGDILEHLDLSVAKNVLTKKLAKTIIVIIPYNFKQGVYLDNIYEIHKQNDLTHEIFLERYKDFNFKIICKTVGSYYMRQEDKNETSCRL